MKKIAAIQMCSSHILEDNLLIVSKYIQKASQQGAEVVVLPEMFPIIGKNAVEKIQIAENYGTGKIQDFLAKQARSNNIWIIGGTIPITSEDQGKIRAACLVYNNNGDQVVRYDKIHLFDVNLSATESYKESATVTSGNEVVVFDSPVGKIGLAVCYDIRFPEMFRLMMEKGAEVFCVPSAFTYTTGKKHWEILAKSRAVENICYFVGACQGGTHTNGRQTYGNSLIVDPDGIIMSRLGCEDSGVIINSIDLELLCELRTQIPIAEHLRFRVLK